MTRLNNISHAICRTVLASVLLCMAVGTAAQTVAPLEEAPTQTVLPWDGTTATRPAGIGTEDDPYIIATAENLYYVAQHPKYYVGKHLTQTADIDLGGNDWIPIGNSANAFAGIYDGTSHAIRGLRVDWGQYALIANEEGKAVTSETNYAYGLFGYLTGSVENLVIDGASIYQSKPKTTKTFDNDMRVGILAGAVGCTTNNYIRNILIRNSSITSHPDNTSESGNCFLPSAYMIGALVGDVHANDSYTSSSEVKPTINFTIQNIYIDADFDVNCILRSGRSISNKGQQYYVGGLIGRIRTVHLQHTPKHAVYSGKINAPLAMAGPIFGGARALGGGDNTKIAVGSYVGLVNAYAGDFCDKALGSASDDDFTNTYYSNYRVQDHSDGSASGTERLINDTDPATTLHDNALGTHTLKKQASFTFNANNLNYSNMSMFQGVNRGTYMAPIDATTQENAIEKLNTDNTSEFRFVWRNSRVELQGRVEIDFLQRTSIFRGQAKVRNLQLDQTYTYRWTLSDASGHTWWATCTTDNIAQTNSTGEVVLKILSNDRVNPSCAIVGTMRAYKSIRLEIFEGNNTDEGNLLATDSYDELSDLHIDLVRGVKTSSTTTQIPVLDEHGDPVMQDVVTVNKEHFLYTADMVIDDHHITDEPAFFDGIKCEWLIVDPKVTDADGDGFVPLSSSEDYCIEGTFPDYEAHISPTYVGKIRLRITCQNPDAPGSTPLVITSSVIDGTTVDYIEQTIKGLHLDLTMEEFWGNIEHGNINTLPFDPKDYHIVPEAGKNGFYDAGTAQTIAKVGNRTTYGEGLIDTITANAKVKPLIFKVKVVDQFGNDWTQARSASNRYRIQWNYRISGEGTNNQKSTNYNETYSPTDGHYDEVNGWFDKDDEENHGLLFNVARTETDWNNLKKAEDKRNTGHLQLINDSILIIHPNLLHRTSAFWVRVKLYDILNDPEGKHPAETTLAFNQLGLKFEKTAVNEDGYTLAGKVVWNEDSEEKLYESSTSRCDLTWYKNPDPTNPNGWEFVDSLHNVQSRYTTLDVMGNDTLCFYKLVYKSGSDLVVEDIYGPHNVVYVYNHVQTTANLDRTDFRPYDQQTNMYYPTGLDTNHGHDPYHAVATMEQAYKILDKKGTQDDNIVVVMGYLEDTDYLYKESQAKYRRCATITGSFGNISGGTLNMVGSDNNGRHLGAATTFRDLTFYGKAFDKDAGQDIPKELHFYCDLNDVTFDTGLKMVDYGTQSENTNGLGDYKAPKLTIIAGSHNRAVNDNLVYPSTNSDTTKVTMTFRSGTFARIISGTRNSGGGANVGSKNIFGTPSAPHRVKVVVDIQDERTDEYPYDIGLLVGGQTDGTVYIESELEMKAGTVGRFISGNISYGRNVNKINENTFYPVKYPSDSFYGSTTLNLRGGMIRELYGGTLGRHEASTYTTELCDAYFYGRSIINVYDGLIESNIYGAGAGGVTGVGDHDHHTGDTFIPYYTTATPAPGTKPLYGTFEEIEENGYTIPTMIMSTPDNKLEDNGEGEHNVLDLAKSYVEVNVYGGTILGNIYGAGYGYSKQIAAEKAFDQAGYLFGDCYVNITGGTVDGNIYGGGEGSDNYVFYYAAHKYYAALVESGKKADAANKTRVDFVDSHKDEWLAGNFADSKVNGVQYVTQDDIDAAKAKFGALAHVYGNADVKISGGTITGNIYGGSKGVVGYEDMAKLTGNTSVTISGDVSIVGKVVNKVSSGGHVYGGASLSEIRGNTELKLLGGYVGGNVFGGSEGSAQHPDMATVYGKTYLLLDGAEVNASIYGGCNVSSIRKPIPTKPKDMTDEAYEAQYEELFEEEYKVKFAAYGKGEPLSYNTVDTTYQAMTKVIINSGEIGNNIYGGSRGNATVEGSVTDIEGDTYVRINGGSYKNLYYLSNKDGEAITDGNGNKRYRDFNIFGGGESKCEVKGTARLDVRSGLMNIPSMVPPALPYYDDDEMQEAAENAAPDSTINIFIPHEENPNSLAKNNTSKFQGPYMDYTYRRFSLYGGGYGEQTNCLNTDVYVYIPTDKRKPHGRTLKVPYDHQFYFDIAGGGYSGNIGYWLKEDGSRVEDDAPAGAYHHYYEGNCKVTIDGFVYCRKVIGGGFYGSCNTTNTKVICGSLRQTYGGSLLGYVHKQAFLEIGNRPDQLTDYNDPAVEGMTNEQKAKWLNDYIYFTENVYGGNDVKGIVGTKRWEWNDNGNVYYGQEGTDGGPLWQADIDESESKGVVMNIFGGTFMGDVYGAGNGHYRGYYVPGWIRYEDGPARNYRNVRCVVHGMTYDEHVKEIKENHGVYLANGEDGFAPETEANKAAIAAAKAEIAAIDMREFRVYRTRPMVGSVNINIAGNGTDDMVHFRENFYGGGRECSIGQWNTILPMEDPRRLSTGGHLHINVGGNVDFGKNFYMGVYGGLYGNQQYVPDSVNIDTFNGQTTTTLEEIGEVAYDHWYFNPTPTPNHQKGRYEPGFPAPGTKDGNFGLLGEHMFRGYFKNIEMEGDIELTFYKDLYEYPKDAAGHPITTNGKTKRRRWLPAELAVDAYDAENITMNSFFLGGKCGSMTNNTYTVYCFTDSVGKNLRNVALDTIPGHIHEKWGSVYRIVMPKGVTIKDKLVMGVEDAVTNFYPYNSAFTAADSVTVEGKKVMPDPYYTFEGGIVTQTTFSFDVIAYNDMMTKECEDHNLTAAEEDKTYWNPTISLPLDFYHNAKYAVIRDNDSYTLESGIYAGMKIYRRIYDTYGLKNYMLRPNPAYEIGNGKPKYLFENNQERRYGLAVVYNDTLKTHKNGNEPGAEPFYGRRSLRTAVGDHQTVTKLTARCLFEPQKGSKPVDVDPDLSEELREKGYHKLYGGIIYGGCYNSGVVIGDVILNVASNMLGSNVTPDNQSDWFDHISGLGHYIGRVYGGGYGAATRNDGDTYINLLRDVQAMNVFGGGMQGSVNGNTNINYIGTDRSYIYGAIYGGGFQGDVGKCYWRNNDFQQAGKPTILLSQNEYNRLTEEEEEEEVGGIRIKGKRAYHRYVETNGTNLTLVSGNVDHVYGGSCMGNLYGATQVHLYDEVATELPHLDFSRYDSRFTTNWSDARLIVGTVYGGNDISGEVVHTDPKYQTVDGLFDTQITMTEKHDESGKLDTPGASDGYNGFPLVGNLYGGSNGDYGDQRLVVDTLEASQLRSYYVYANGSKIKYASGRENEILEVNIGDTIQPLAIPNVDRANIQIEGGTVVNLYGGGDMSTITGLTNIRVAYVCDSTKHINDKDTLVKGNMDARAGFKSEADLMRAWNCCHISAKQQMSEVMNYDTRTFHYNIYRIFGGNNHADMAIQPSWDLKSGHVGSVYSGGNFGRMTFFDGSDASKLRGLTLEVNSRNFHANALYGGGRVGNIAPNVGSVKPDSTFYGATLVIKDGVIDHVYGGNDVSGEVDYGSRVDIQGAISGDVYCAGNGNYVYKYGYEPEYAGNIAMIGEDYHITNETTKDGYRYFILPLKDAYDITIGTDDEKKLKKVAAINSYRPNVKRCLLAISGKSADNPAYVHGSVYMGGNSASVVPSGEKDFVEFNIGSNVIINNIFMGSNGESLVDDKMIMYTNYHNDFSIGESDDMLNTYMQAVDVEDLPRNFALNDTIRNANIGSFFLGGNRGSMTTGKTIELEFPRNITIFGKIVGGSNNANFDYGAAHHKGGLNTPMEKKKDKDGNPIIDAKGDTVRYTDKVRLAVHSQFRPKYLRYPDGDWRRAHLIDDVRDSLSVPLYRYYDTANKVAKAYYHYNDTTKQYSDEYTGLTYLQPGTCNIYGGCYNSGITRGNIKIDLYSDMLQLDTKDTLALRTRERTVINCVDGLNDKSWHPCSVIGGGYGAGTSVYGNIDVRLLPTVTGTGDDRRVQHPSCVNVFGGAQEGTVVGNTTVELRDGTVLANVYGASESSYMYGSTQLLIGYPEHYECLETNQYPLARADVYSKAVTDDNWKTHQNDTLHTEVVKQSVWYRRGDIVPKNIYERILATATTKADSTALIAKFAHHDEDTPSSVAAGATWDDIDINVGDPSSCNARTAEAIEKTPYFGYGNVYGGGFVPTAKTSALIGQKTLRRYRDSNRPDDISDLPTGHKITSYGGNSSIMIWDNPENAKRNAADTGYLYAVGGKANGEGGSGATIRDHVSIGTAQFKPVAMTEGKNKMGLYYFKPGTAAVPGTEGNPGTPAVPSEFVHQPSGKYSAATDTGKHFYEIEADGGIYGGGRKVFCEGFRACDLAYYGYADYTPQMAKFINTFQRFDLLSLTDCCLQLQAAQDFASTTMDAGEKYSIIRVGELRMNSSLAGSKVKLDEGVEDTVNTGNTKHNTKRSRNFLGFFRSVKFLGSLVSNVGFTDTLYHDATGTKGTVSYSDKKKAVIDDYYDPDNFGTTEGGERFKKRNVGTSANMIGINNGYSLRLQGTRQKKDESNKDVDDAYFGPALGVTEIKLLTMALGEGGGYVYALNKHEEKPANEPSKLRSLEASKPHVEASKSRSLEAPQQTNAATPSFLQTLGNFVFPGAKFGLDEGQPCQNFIIDDCFPIGHGYDKYIEHTTCAAQEPYDHTAGVNVNKEQEIHYWYVNGQRYFFNATLTAYTGTPETGKLDWFTLDNSDNLIMLAGIDNNTQYLRVKSIKWEAPDAAYDLTRTSGLAPDSTEISTLLPGYNLYVTVGEKPQELIRPGDTNKQKAWTAQLKRTDYTLVDSVKVGDTMTFKEDYYDDVNIAPVAGNDNAGNGRYKADMPLLGLALTDEVANNGKRYYEEHLSQPSKVQLVLGAHNADGLDYEYTLNLTIVYLKGTDVMGHIIIENCALPGERIYANAFDVKVEGDDPNITRRQWLLYKIDVKEDNSTETMPALEIPDNFRVEENDPERIALPAYLWMDGWHLAYELTINGKKERVLTAISDTTEHKVVNVHNYHRMMAWDRKTKNGTAPDIQDLQLTNGARVYIEDDDDLAYFLTYMNDSVQSNRFGDTEDKKKLHRGHIGNNYLPAEYDDIVVVNPQYAEGLHFILMNDVKVKDATTADQDYRFEGRLSGLGHAIDLNNCKQFMGENGELGSIYFTGFLSNSSTPSKLRSFEASKPQILESPYYVTGTNNGRIFGCFHYNPDHKGLFIKDKGNSTADQLQYCYQNSVSGLDDAYGYTTYYDDHAFENGKAAYDLNAFYLIERYKIGAKTPTANENERFRSYVNNYYADGSYRYAAWDRANNIGTPTALRRYEHPNYYTLGKITQEQMDEMAAASTVTPVGVAAAKYGRAASYHKIHCHAAADTTRHHVNEHYINVEVGGTTQPVLIPDYYKPNYPQDFIFYGQDIKQGGDLYPTPLRADGQNRVYRASGFYGTQVDSGYYFNRADALMRHPRLTAVDFTGNRMRDESATADAKTADKFLLNNQVFSKGGYTKQSLIFPPVLDLPIDPTMVSGYASLDSRALDSLRYTGTVSPDSMLLGGISVVGNGPTTETGKVTKNLLVYIPTDKTTDAPFHQHKDEALVEAHRIDWDGTAYTTDSLHLVDRQDFNAPIPFNITKRAWYERRPGHYASRGKRMAGGFVIGKDAWEGVSLPFNATTVQAVHCDTEAGLDAWDDRGEISHFYGSDPDRGITHHDYWLRGLVGTAVDTHAGDDVMATATFARPGVADSTLFDLGADQHTADYLFNNNDKLYHFYATNGYVKDHDEYGDTLLYKGYRYLTCNAPYIVSFPGEDYYEFDLSGKFYQKKLGKFNPQKIVYENRDDVHIAVTDEEAAKRVTAVTAGGITTAHHGTFAHLAATADHYALNANDVENVDIFDNVENVKKKVSLPAGSAFINCADFGGVKEILPFRTYVTVDNVSSPSPAPRYVLIGEGAGDSLPVPDEEEKHIDNLPTALRVYVVDGKLHIDSPAEGTMPLHTISGLFFRTLRLAPGTNVYADLPRGCYVVHRKKVLLR